MSSETIRVAFFTGNGDTARIIALNRRFMLTGIRAILACQELEQRAVSPVHTIFAPKDGPVRATHRVLVRASDAAVTDLVDVTPQDVGELPRLIYEDAHRRQAGDPVVELAAAMAGMTAAIQK